MVVDGVNVRVRRGDVTKPPINPQLPSSFMNGCVIHTAYVVVERILIRLLDVDATRTTRPSLE